MSSGSTHALVGAVAGIGVARLLGLPLTANVAGIASATVIAASTFLAMLPDIDEPGAWISQRFRLAIILAATALGAFVGVSMIQSGQLGRFAGVNWSTVPYSGLVPVLGGVVGLVIVGPTLAKILLRLIRTGAGGHRRLTHSGLVAVVSGGLAWWLWTQGATTLAMLPGALAYAILVHDIGDLVTPAGVPLLYPLSSISFGIPRPFSRFGETALQAAAVIAGYVLIQ